MRRVEGGAGCGGRGKGNVECVKVVLLKAGADTEIAGKFYKSDVEDITPLIAASCYYTANMRSSRLPPPRRGRRRQSG